MGFPNPFKSRTASASQAPRGLGGYDWEGAIAALTQSPGMSDRAFADAMGPHGWSNQICDDVKKVHRYREAVEREVHKRAEQRAGHEERVNDGTASPTTTAPAGEKRGFFSRLFGRAGRKQEQASAPAGEPQPHTDNPGTDAPHSVNADKLDLVNYTPEQLMAQIQQTLSGVSLDMPLALRIKWIAGQIWSVIGPALLFAGTAGEVFFFIWNNTDNKAAWWVALSVLVTVCVLECTFMVVSYQSDALRNDMKQKPGGPTLEDKKDLNNHKIFWFILGVGVGIGQISFLIAAMQAKMGNLPFLIAFSVGRSAFTLAGDFYTAYIHKEMPSSGDRAAARIKRESDLTAELLRRKAEQVTIINDGTLLLREQHTAAIIKDESAQTELQMKRLENKSRIEARQTLDDQARLFTNLGSGMMRALFDPAMHDDERQKLLGVMQGFMSAAKYLPADNRTVIQELPPEDEDEDEGL